MSSKKKTNKAEAQRAERTIQYAGIALIVIVIAIIAAPYIAKLYPKANEGNSTAVTDIGSETACAVFDSIPAAEQYSEVPALLIDQSKQYFATFKMAKGGEFTVELYPAKAPITVNSFVFLACKDFYDGVTFHRVIEGFMAQGGDPTGTGSGGPGYEFVNEDSDQTFDKKGVVAMANAGRDTNGSQFFITFDQQPFLNGGYTIFGQVVEGMEVVDSITLRDPQTNPSFTGDAIETIIVTMK